MFWETKLQFIYLKYILLEDSPSSFVKIQQIPDMQSIDRNIAKNISETIKRAGAYFLKVKLKKFQVWTRSQMFLQICLHVRASTLDLKYTE